MNPKKYTYGNLNKFNNRLFLFFTILFLSVGLFFLYGFILSLFNLGGVESSAAFTLFLYFLGFGVWSPLVFVYIAHLRTDVEVEEDGLRVKFMFKTLYVKWDDIFIIKQARYFGFRMSRKNSVVVTKKALTLFHRIYGLMYGQINQPSFMILSNIGHYDELIVTIKGNIQKKK